MIYMYSFGIINLLSSLSLSQEADSPLNLGHTKQYPRTLVKHTKEGNKREIKY
jgi:hypothetical protein